MLLILTLGLFPLGLIAILASVQSARDNSLVHQEEVHARLQTKAQRINDAISRSVLTMRAASAAITLASPNSAACQATLQRLERAQPGRYALFRGGAPACSSAGFAPPATIPEAGTKAAAVAIDPDGQTLRFAVFGPTGIEGIAEIGRQSLARLADLPAMRFGYDLELVDANGNRMTLKTGYSPTPLTRTVIAGTRLLGNRLELRTRAGAAPISAAELLMILLPIFMWLFAGIIGWIIVDRLLLRPLVRMQRAVSAYQPGDREFHLPPLATPAQEISQLGIAFEQVTQTVARHEAELEAAIDRQTRLVREVHHRVKNNLQVVASLLNLHARGAQGEDVAAAYASIQRRVDALAVVHRNHYAELEENRGVGLKPLISELAANLRATAPSAASHMQIRLDVAPYHVTQDVAVSVAFLVTELVELAMFCGAASVSISLDGNSGPTARLRVESDSLKAGNHCDEKIFERFDRIVTGLSRQLRSVIDRNLEVGAYSLDIAVIDKADG